MILQQCGRFLGICNSDLGIWSCDLPSAGNLAQAVATLSGNSTDVVLNLLQLFKHFVTRSLTVGNDFSCSFIAHFCNGNTFGVDRFPVLEHEILRVAPLTGISKAFDLVGVFRRVAGSNKQVTIASQCAGVLVVRYLPNAGAKQHKRHDGCDKLALPCFPFAPELAPIHFGNVVGKSLSQPDKKLRGQILR